MKTNIIIAVLSLTMSISTVAQNYTTVADGAWTNASNWNNSSGFGSATPPLDGTQGSGVITIKNNVTITGNYSLGSPTLDINSGKTLTVNGNITLGGGSAVTVTGNLVINGNLTLNSTLQILPGGVVTVNGSVTVNNSQYLLVGNGNAPPSYADIIIKSDLKLLNSGDMMLNKNGRMAVFGNVADDGSGGTKLSLKDGAQAYVNGNINFTGGNDDISNSNSASPYGLYVNGTTTNSGSGSSTTANEGNKATMQSTNPSFASWVTTEQTLMPVTLLYFAVDNVSEEGIALKWETATEENFDYFIVESSTDGHEFIDIAHIASEKDHHYNYTVANPSIGKTYFRLKSVDLDGYTEVFKMISAVYESSKSVAVFPNPVVDSKLNVNFNFNPAEDVSISITDLNGIEVIKHIINAMDNQLILSLDAGTYLLKIQSSEVNSVSRIVIR